MIFGLVTLIPNAFSPPIPCPSLHFIGETDVLKQEGTALLESFVDPVVIHHPQGHTVPRLDEKAQETVLQFIRKIWNISSQEE
ncbi:unnamed protein product, partial [Vitis vinifera]